MKILALELSSKQGSIAWLEDDNVSWVKVFANDRKHSGLFFQNLQDCSRRFGAPEAIVVGLGPGSYAGVRIAIATAIGLRVATGAKIRGISSSCAVDTSEDEYWVIGDARRDSFFLGRISRRKLIDGFSLHSSDELLQRLMEIDEAIYVSEPLPQFPRTSLVYPSAAKLAELARDRLGETNDEEILEPIYLRTPYITKSSKPRIFVEKR